jgi:hypothetical protein
MKRLALIMAVVAVALTATAPAYGQSAVGDAYGGNGGGIMGAVSEGGPGGGNGGETTSSAPAQVQVASADSGSLPFTGLDLGLLALGGVVLVGVGVGLRRFARPLS